VEINQSPSPAPEPAPDPKPQETAGRKRRGRIALIAAGLVAGGITGGYGVAYTAAAASPSPGSAPGSAAAGARHQEDKTAEQQAIATAIGITPAQLTTEVQGGKTLAQVAQAHGVDPAKVISAVATIETKEIDDALAAGRITQAQADAKKAGVQAEATTEVNQTRPPGGKRGGAGDAADQKVIADSIGISASQLLTELQGGKTVAQVAQAHGTDPAKVVSALVAEETKEIDDALAAGKITKDRADKAKAALPQRVQNQVNGVRGGRPGGSPPPTNA
jgi:uncharacterized protein YidB (DUF937 family)